ncbi:hypothetical protein J437_LFUL002352, partial [Ladona fulva]
IIALVKPGKPPNQANSFFPIALLSICYKLLERLLFNRISPTILESVLIEQAGFKPQRSCADQFSWTLPLRTIPFGSPKAFKTTHSRNVSAIIDNMLANRVFQVTLGIDFSRARKLTNSLPQGS